MAIPIQIPTTNIRISQKTNAPGVTTPSLFSLLYPPAVCDDGIIPVFPPFCKVGVVLAGLRRCFRHSQSLNSCKYKSSECICCKTNISIFCFRLQFLRRTCSIDLKNRNIVIVSKISALFDPDIHSFRKLYIPPIFL